jgi:phosphohistidine phosphatase SixA
MRAAHAPSKTTAYAGGMSSIRQRGGSTLRRAAVLACLLAGSPTRAADLPADELWSRLAGGGLVILLRHAAAPGTYDPPGFRIDDCATQRNLSAAGREQARRVGEAVRARGVRIERVRSSRWCRARDTAALAFGSYEPWPELDSTRGADPGDLAERAARVRASIATWAGPGTLVLVTHQFVISEVVGRGARDGEMIVVAPRPGGLAVLGSLVIEDKAAR